VNPSIHGGEIPAGAFLGKSIPEAVKAYLSLVKKKQTTREISEALVKGGMETSGKGSFETIVSSALYRVRNQGDIVRVKGAWGLSEWWPAGIRAAGGQEKRRPRKSKKPKAKGPTSFLPPEKSISTLAAGSSPKKLSDRIVEILTTHPSQEFGKEYLSKQFGVNVRVIAMVMANLVKKGVAVMSAPGTYRAPSN
jgi:hypothetical protein